ncbi:MAG TPA: glycosyltransferase family 4 protein [Pyrinomonadaceae bacterium]|jgi:glycosyltransferase involved in cell wall biosynthesis
MKILFYNHQGKVSGAERVILLVLKRLNRSFFEPLMVCPATDSMADETRRLGVPCRTVNEFEARFTVRPDKLMRYFFSFVRTIKELRAEISGAKPDVIHANSIRSGLVATAASIGTKVPVIWHLHDELGTHPISTFIRVFAACFNRTRLMPVSEATGKSFRGRFLRLFGKHLDERVIHNGIELEEFKFNAANRSRIREDLGLGDKEFVFGIVGQITPRKGQLELLQTFARIQTEIPSKLLIVGAPMFNRDELYFQKLKQTVKDLGIENRVVFLGARNDVAAILQSLDALVINSRSEALVLVALEAMACRTPIIATDTGGTKEIITHKKTGWLVRFGDERALAEALVEFGKNPELRRSFAEEGERVAVDRFDAKHFISQVEEFYKQCATSEKRAVSNDLAIQS